jgi:hypothetical protein
MTQIENIDDADSLTTTHPPPPSRGRVTVGVKSDICLTPFSVWEGDIHCEEWV